MCGLTDVVDEVPVAAVTYPTDQYGSVDVRGLMVCVVVVLILEV